MKTPKAAQRAAALAAGAAGAAARVALAAASDATMAKKKGRCAVIPREPKHFFMHDRLVLHAPLKTRNVGTRNRTIDAGTHLIVAEFGDVMFGACGYLRLSPADLPSTGDWVWVRDLRRAAYKMFPVEARVRFKTPGSGEWQLGTVATKCGTTDQLRLVTDFGEEVLLDGCSDVAMLSGALEYTSEGGSSVSIAPEVDPWKELGVTVGAAKQEVRSAYRDQVCNEPSRQRRAMLSLCFNAIGQLHGDAGDEAGGGTSSGMYYLHAGSIVTFESWHPMVLAAAGAVGCTEGGTLSIKRMLQRDHRSRTYITKADECGETLLYKAARSGFYDLVRTLLDAAGMEVDLVQNTGSTALHAACYYGHKDVAQLLVARGADTERRNYYRNTPLEEAHPRLSEGGMLTAALGLGVGGKVETTVFCTVMQSGLGDDNGVQEVSHNGKIVARKLRLETACSVPGSYEKAWHGTKAQYVVSILRHGLHASGTALPDGTELKPSDNHYQLGSSHQGIANWAAAIFVSPSVSYASHACYAERVMEGGKMWAVVIDCAVRPRSFTRHNQTVQGGYTALPGEPMQPEYRVAVEDECDGQIMRIHRHTDVVVTGCTLIDIEFLESCCLSFLRLRDLLS